MKTYIWEMAHFRCIATLTWQFDSDLSEAETLAYAKKQLEQILDCHPQGEAFDDFSVQVDLAHMKDRTKLVHIGEFKAEDVFPYVTAEDVKREYQVKGKSYFVRMNSDRYFVFRNNPKCVACGLEGSRIMLDVNPGDQSPHFNLYGEEDGRLVLLTKDHIVPKSKGGEDDLMNFQVMCATCNNLKAAEYLSVDQVRELRRLYDNDQKLPKKELRDLINRIRGEMAAKKCC